MGDPGFAAGVLRGSFGANAGRLCHCSDLAERRPGETGQLPVPRRAAASGLPSAGQLPAQLSADSPARLERVLGLAIRSGEFLIPPTAAAPNPANRALAAAWRTSPWLWPYGAYQVTVTSATGTTRVILDLMLTD